MEIVKLGNTGINVSRLAFGTGTHGWSGRSQQTDLGVDKLAGLLRQAYDHGVNFWDAADMYGSHPHIAKALVGLPRDKVVIATKTTAQSNEQITQNIERFLRELNTDVIDVVLLHFMTQANWSRTHASAMEALSRAKEQGKVRAVGVSCHGLKSLRVAAESDWAEVVLARINPAGVNMDASPAQVVPILERMYASGKAVWGMKVLGCGQLAGKARAAIQYVLQLGIVHSLVIGTSAKRELLENVRLVEELAPRYPLRALSEVRNRVF
jgi:aryl-alcohol dehydrogenase-like predicted oxidoreductase